MTTKGQIVEIPANSPLYSREKLQDLPKKEELILESKGNAYSLFDGFLVGEHPGVEHFKLGQRKGIKVGGKKQPLYVIQIDLENNRLFVGAGENHPGLWTKVLSFNANFFQWNQEKTFTHKELETGVAVDILSSIVVNRIPATLYIFQDILFIEFEKPNLISIKDHSIKIYYQNMIIANTIK